MSWREGEAPTIDSHLHYHTPIVYEDSDQWDWPYWKFGYRTREALFEELHVEYNSIKSAIQDPFSWHLDVCQIADLASTREEFETLLKKRRDERFEELIRAWDEIALMLITESHRFMLPRKRTDYWARFIRISRHFSYDAIVGYFGAYCKEQVVLPPPEDDENNPFLTEKAKELLRQQRLEVEKQARVSETESENAGTERFLLETVAGPSTQRGPPELQIKEPTKRDGKQPENSYRKPQMVDRATQTTTPTIMDKVVADEIPSSQATNDQKRGVKRQRQKSKPIINNPQGVRRSARLQEQAERQAKRRRL
ncbi:hypothetical protein F5B22DRAFT_629199 [Xylaria bambusicola]|uniref:uncharacterized protein n=1 Tax=Xylaria bambusicola TaxID=326684 RepID=UPI0020082427|nr:uncharacterized protein F5B22DRAFT_629199 [Xylaria bambusicola]KAI0503379.1 hypothetical protein F5B22DRAFT_629199 [Xylaria bambusicola]